MRPCFYTSFFVAVAFHTLLLFGYRLGTGAKPLPVVGEAASVAVNLIDSTPGSETVAVAAPKETPDPVPASEPVPTPEPEPTPAAIQEPSADPMEATPPQPTPPPQFAASSKPKVSGPPSKEKRSVANVPAHSPSSGSGKTASMTGNHGASGSPLPRYRSNPKPDYPFEALRARHEGVVVITIEVSADGRPTAVSLQRSSGFPELDQSALRTLWRWRFEPALRAGFPVASHVNVPIRFHAES